MSEMHEGGKSTNLHRYGPAAGLAGLVGIGVMVAGLAGWNPAAWQAYLFAWICWLGLSLGCLGLLLLMHTVNGSWGLPVLRVMEAAASKRNFIALAVMFLPILYTVLAGNPILYPWADPAKVAADHLLEMKKPYLNAGFFTIRAVIYFLAWYAMAAGLSASTLRQDKSKNTREQDARASWAAPGIVVFFLTVTFAFTDWIMSLEPHWSSTIYGAWWIVGMALMALAFVTIVAALNKYREPFDGVITANWTKDLGNLMLTFTMLWGYTTISQYLIIWSGNIPEYITYFVRRSENHWNAIGMATMLGQFFIPFFCLLSSRVKAQSKLIAQIAGFILVMRVVDMYYVIMPAMRNSPMPSPWDILALVGVGGLWIFCFASAIRKAPLMPEYDPRLWENAHAH